MVVRAPCADGADEWLIVDGCTSESLIYPEALLDHYGASPSAIVLSHPHRDHARGLARLVERFTSPDREAWPKLAMVPAPDTAGAGDDWDLTAAYQGGVAEHVIATIWERWRSRPSCRWDLEVGSSRRLGDATVQVLSPIASERDAAREAWLARRRHDYNRAASALLVTWRGRRVLLGSDLVESPGQGWTNVTAHERTPQAHDVYKIAHHGAIRAIGPQAGPPPRPRLRTWLATPFASKGLPKARPGEGLERLLASEDHVELTGLPLPHHQQGETPREAPRHELDGLMSAAVERTGAASFPDCFVAVVVRAQGPVEVVRGSGAVRVRA